MSYFFRADAIDARQATYDEKVVHHGTIQSVPRGHWIISHEGRVVTSMSDKDFRSKVVRVT